ncbi:MULTISPECIES: hypothetical protein [Microvirga]|uniref:hypothetical protein n=1 Tax=Microvirga TaxID=186650 RepID=UPI0021C91380|nr:MULTISPECIES: hypothetical protein [unclassified Microvirga]
MSNPVIEVSEDLRDKLLFLLNDHQSDEVQQFIDKLRKDSLRDFKGFIAGVSNLPDLSPVNRALQATWWFIENVREDDWRRNEIYFELRSLVRQVSSQELSAPESKPSTYIRFETGREDRFSENHGPFEFVQATNGTIRVGSDGEREIAQFVDGLWHTTDDGQTWSDFVIFTENKPNA